MDSTQYIQVLLSRCADERTSTSKTRVAYGNNSESASMVLRLFDRFQTPVLKYVITFGISFHDAEDVVQETFLSLFRHLELSKPCYNPDAWLFRVAHNLALKRRAANQVSERRAADVLHLENLAHPASDALANLTFNQRQKQLQAVLQALPETDRRCLCLRAEGLKYRHISKILGVSLGTVASSLSRSLAKMSRAVGDE